MIPHYAFPTWTNDGDNQRFSIGREEDSYAISGHDMYYYYWLCSCGSISQWGSGSMSTGTDDSPRGFGDGHGDSVGSGLSPQ
jgi:hypothetical protein